MSVKLNDGTSIPTIAFGSGTALYGKDAAKAVVLAIKTGFRHIDTAQAYANEDSVGEAIQQAGVDRSELYITTKLHKLPADQTVSESLKTSLQKLQLEYVDLFLIHNPIEHKDIKAVWKGMEEAKAAGLTKSIGLSNFQVSQINEILEVATVVPAVNQVRTDHSSHKTDTYRTTTHPRVDRASPVRPQSEHRHPRRPQGEQHRRRVVRRSDPPHACAWQRHRACARQDRESHCRGGQPPGHARPGAAAVVAQEGLRYRHVRGFVYRCYNETFRMMADWLSGTQNVEQGRAAAGVPLGHYSSRHHGGRGSGDRRGWVQGALPCFRKFL
jgi:hypothetical protein